MRRKAIESVDKKLSVNHAILRIWIRRTEINAGIRLDLTTDEWARMKNLELEIKELW